MDEPLKDTNKEAIDTIKGFIKSIDYMSEKEAEDMLIELEPINQRIDDYMRIHPEKQIRFNEYDNWYETIKSRDLLISDDPFYKEVAYSTPDMSERYVLQVGEYINHIMMLGSAPTEEFRPECLNLP